MRLIPARPDLVNAAPAPRVSGDVLVLQSGKPMARGTPTETSTLELHEVIDGIPMSVTPQPERRHPITFVR